MIAKEGLLGRDRELEIVASLVSTATAGGRAFDELKAKAQRRADWVDADVAATDANFAEADAYAAIDYADWAVWPGLGHLPSPAVFACHRGAVARESRATSPA